MPVDIPMTGRPARRNLVRRGLAHFEMIVRLGCGGGSRARKQRTKDPHLSCSCCWGFGVSLNADEDVEDACSTLSTYYVNLDPKLDFTLTISARTTSTCPCVLKTSY